MSISSRIQRILSGGRAEQQANFCSLVDEVVSSLSLQNLQLLLSNIVSNPELGVQLQKVVMLHFANAMKTLPSSSLEELAISAVNAFRQAIPGVFDESDFVIREALFEHFVAQEDFKTAAEYLSGINLDSSVKVLSDEEKADVLIRTAESFLEEDEAMEAEIFVNKASTVMNNVSNWSLQLRFRVTSARVMDANRKFLDAAYRYYEISSTNNASINQSDLLELLGKAITCAVLGKFGAQRSRLITIISQDPRLSKLETHPQYSGHPTVLGKMHGAQLLRAAEFATFENSLLPHQKAVTGEGLTISQKAMLEHNMAAISKLYANISFIDLANFLKLTPDVVQKISARMISEDRLTAHIDQTVGFLFFDDDGASATSKWDSRIAAVCDEVSNLAELIEPART